MKSCNNPNACKLLSGAPEPRSETQDSSSSLDCAFFSGLVFGVQGFGFLLGCFMSMLKGGFEFRACKSKFLRTSAPEIEAENFSLHLEFQSGEGHMALSEQRGP